MNVLIVAAHPDDDALGCGGVMAGHVQAGDRVRVLYVTMGEKGIPEMVPADAAKMRRDEAGQAQACIGFELIVAWNEPDRGVSDRAWAIAKSLDALLASWPPAMVYTPHENDDHPDHAAIAGAVREIWESRVRTQQAFVLRQFEIWTPLARPDVTIDISPYASVKRAAIRAHRSQESRNGFAEAMLALNHYRGIMFGPHQMYAECFQELRP